MASILSASKREIDFTLVLTFPDATVLRFATSPLVISAQTYSNDLENVGEIRQTLETPIDRISVSLQNKDRVLGLHLASYWQKWRKAKAVVGRQYRSGTLTADVEMFNGVVQQPNANDLKVFFDIIPDTTAPGEIVCQSTLALMCGFVFKDEKTCAYSGIETKCDHHLKSKTGCDGRVNSEHFGGMEHRYAPDASVPGTGGNTVGGGGSGGCPRLDQFVLVKNLNGKPMPKMVCFLDETDLLFNPVSHTFHEIASMEVIKNAPIFEMVAANGAVCFSSHSHKVLWFREHITGEVVTRSIPGDPILTFFNKYPSNDLFLTDSKILVAHDSREIADVMKIEMKDGHIYAAGDSDEKFIVSHNLKNPLDDINPFIDI